jgi:hypothetical protein
MRREIVEKGFQVQTPVPGKVYLVDYDAGETREKY